MRLTALFSLLIFLSAKADMESLPNYTVSKPEKDASLKKGETRFNFSVVDAYSARPLYSPQKFAINGKEKKVVTTSTGKFTLVLKPGKYLFQAFLSEDYYEIKTDSINGKEGMSVNITLHFKSSVTPVMEEKPVIYLYPKEKTELSVQLHLKGDMLFSYPEYKNGWKGTADKDGKLEMNGRKCDYLFWEGKGLMESLHTNFESGFLVQKDSTVRFLEEQLSAMGLNDREQEDFITYWAPQMAANKSNLVHFIFNEDFSKYAALNIEPRPDHVFRVFMVWKKADAESAIVLKPQQIEKANRNGFSVIEWGGACLDKLSFKNSINLN